jgi:hypothetical protein
MLHMKWPRLPCLFLNSYKGLSELGSAPVIIFYVYVQSSNKYFAFFIQKYIILICKYTQAYHN